MAAMATFDMHDIHAQVEQIKEEPLFNPSGPPTPSTIVDDVPEFILEEGKSTKDAGDDMKGTSGDELQDGIELQNVPTPVAFKGRTIQDRTSNFFSLFKMTEKEASIYLTYIVEGWSDATAGVLIPFMENYFKIGYMTVSVIFVGQFIGFFTASLANTYLVDRLGFGKLIVLGAVCQMLSYIFMFPPINFPVLAVAYVLAGFGMAIQNACGNAYIGGLPDVAWKLGLLHSTYGLGGLISPLVGTAFVSSGIKFSYFYLVTLSLCVVNVAGLLYAFRLKREAHPTNHVREAPGELLKKILTNKVVWNISLFIIVYVGAEVSMGGWIVSFIIRHRGGGASSGYIATGFWSGITLGRLLFPRVNTWVGEKKVVFYYIAVAAAAQFIIWFVPSIAGNALAVALVGFVLGPLFPNAMSLTVKILPRNLHHASMGFMASIGQSGAALFPFIVGVLAQKFGVTVLPMIELALFAVMTVMWTFVPNPLRRSD